MLIRDYHALYLGMLLDIVSPNVFFWFSKPVWLLDLSTPGNDRVNSIQKGSIFLTVPNLKTQLLLTEIKI